MTPYNNDLLSSAALLAALIAVDYIGVLIAIAADLRSGLTKARRNGEKLTSRGFRTTVDKAGGYYLTLFAMTAIDVMIIAAILFLRKFSGWNLPPFPLFTTVGAVGLGIIELKSIMENTKSGDNLAEAAKLVKTLLENPDLRKIAEEVLKNKK
ncbi:MAG: phage holin family protein [Paramuribaculum sp.]|nr:phage holin family protein [Paramuribaculum sp.]